MDQNPIAYVIPSVCAIVHAAFLASRYEIYVTYHESVSEQPMWIVAGFPAVYLVALYVGHRWMSSRPAAFDVTAAMFVYNVYETLLSFTMLLLLLQETVGRGINPFNAPVDKSPRGSLLAYALWINFQSKFVEYFDTVFMLARKKFNQITLLHVSHHAIMGPIMYIIISYAPGGCSAFGPAINSFIHTLMYSYYLITALGFKPAWKMLLTASQLVQFVVILVHALWQLFVAPGVCWPPFVGWVELLLMFQMLFMFGDFFVSSFVRPRRDR